MALHTLRVVVALVYEAVTGSKKLNARFFFHYMTRNIFYSFSRPVVSGLYAESYSNQ